MKVLRPDDIHPSSARLWLWVGRRSCDRWRALQGGHRVAPQDLDDNTGDAETGAECKDIMVYYVGRVYQGILYYYVGRVYQTQRILCRESVSECIGIGECDGATAGRWLWPYASLSRGAACALDLWLASGLTSSISSKRGEKYVDVLLCIDLEKDARIGIKIFTENYVPWALRDSGLRDMAPNLPLSTIHQLLTLSKPNPLCRQNVDTWAGITDVIGIGDRCEKGVPRPARVSGED